MYTRCARHNLAKPNYIYS